MEKFNHSAWWLRILWQLNQLVKHAKNKRTFDTYLALSGNTGEELIGEDRNPTGLWRRAGVVKAFLIAGLL